MGRRWREVVLREAAALYSVMYKKITANFHYSTILLCPTSRADAFNTYRPHHLKLPLSCAVENVFTLFSNHFVLSVMHSLGQAAKQAYCRREG